MNNSSLSRRLTSAKLSSLGRAALVYASRFKFCVFPVTERSKCPHGRLANRGHLDATLDHDRILQWWYIAPNANIGISCAISGLCVLDIDPRNGGDETLADFEKTSPLPKTWTALTPSGGQHFYFRYEGTQALVGTLGSGIDVKHQGYVLAPPSVHPNGRVYVWDAGAHPIECSIAMLPGVVASFTPRTAHGPCVGPAAESFLGVAFAAASWLGRELRDGKCAVRCPWLHEHSPENHGALARGDGRDSSTALLPPTGRARLGAFRCQHGHCAFRTTVDVLRALPPAAVECAARAYPEAYRQALRRLARPHAGGRS